MVLYLHKFDTPQKKIDRNQRDDLFRQAFGLYSQMRRSPDPFRLIEKNPHGKPYFIGDLAEIHFSVSHSGAYWGVAFSDEPIGLDLEDTAERNLSAERIEALAERVFTEDEIDYIFRGGVGIENRDEDDSEIMGMKKRFFRVWTGKEAYMKYTGDGFSLGFKTFSIFAEYINTMLKADILDTDLMVSVCSSTAKNDRMEIVRF